MSYMPLYATVSDNVVSTEGHTSSRRGKVTNVQADINSHFGNVLKVDVSSLGSLPKKDEHYAEERIQHFKEKGDLKKVAVWEGKLNTYKGYNTVQEGMEKVYVNMDLIGLSSSNAKKFSYKFTAGRENYCISPQQLIDVFEYWGELSKIIPKLKIARSLEESNKEVK